jgi:DNA modification methylase
MKSSLGKYLNQIVHGDSLVLLKEIPTSSIDLIFCDPPYNLQLKKELYRPDGTKVNGVNEQWDKFESYENYDKFVITWLKECQRILKKTGSIWISGTYHNIYRIGYHLQNLGFHILNDVIWIKSNPTPNFKGVRLTNSHEVLLWSVKNDKSTGYTFHHHFLKKYNDGKQLRSSWFIRTKGKMLPEVFETSVTPQNERIRDNKGEKLHSVQKPVALMERIILGCTKRGDVVLDPFSGTSTTAYTCRKHGRNFICIEKEQLYIQPSTQRISSLKITRKELNLMFLNDPERFIQLKSRNKHYEKPYSSHKRHIDRLIERYNFLCQNCRKSMDIHQVILSKKDWEKSVLKSNPDIIKITNQLIKRHCTTKDKFSKKRSLIEPVFYDFSKNSVFSAMTLYQFRKLLKDYGFRVSRSNNQYHVYPI